MAAHRYWRLRFDRAASGTSGYYIWLQEVSFRGATDNDLSVGGTPSASSVWDATYTAAGAFDKSTSGNGWCSASGQFPCWLAYDHGTPVDVKSVRVRPHSGASASYFPLDKAFFVEYSDDNVNWTPMLTFANTFSAGVETVVGVGDGGSFKYVAARISRLLGSAEQQTINRALFKGHRVPFVVNLQTSGSGTISGTVTIENIPGSRKVRLYRKHDGMLIRETWSAANGAYSFTNIDPAWEYFVIAHDHLRVYNGVIQDMLVP